MQVKEKIIDVDVSQEMNTSFLEYSYSVIYARALPDARDGLKPVQRRILFQMSQMGLTPEKGHVKSSRVVGEVMGRLHPHGDSAIYDAMVRLAQDFTLRLPMVDGHGNFGSPDDGPAAARYTEVRMAPPAQAMTASLNENVVDMVPNYDNTMLQPEVLPAAIPNLLVNGSWNCGGNGNKYAPAQSWGSHCRRASPAYESAGRSRRTDALHSRAGPAGRRQNRRTGGNPTGIRHRARKVRYPRNRTYRKRDGTEKRNRVHRTALYGRSGESH